MLKPPENKNVNFKFKKIFLVSPVYDQLVLAGEDGRADGAVELLRVEECLVLPPGQVRQEELLAPNITAPSQVVLEQKVSPAVSEHHVTHVAAVLLAGVAGPSRHAALLREGSI